MSTAGETKCEENCSWPHHCWIYRNIPLDLGNLASMHCQEQESNTRETSDTQRLHKLDILHRHVTFNGFEEVIIWDIKYIKTYQIRTTVVPQ